MDEPRVLRVFISSPSDVRPERLKAELVVQRLDREFSQYFRVEPVLWEREPLTATAHFQELITPPRETDIVVVILWSRLGVPLPAEKFTGPLSGQSVTGTEWEFEDALSSYRERKAPDLLLYRKDAPVYVSLDNPAELEESQNQKKLVQDFMSRWFEDHETRSFTAAFLNFTEPADFETQFEIHLRALMLQRLNLDESATVQGEIRWTRGSPFLGLHSFELEHSPVFFGRTRARFELCQALQRQAAGGSAFVMVTGASGSGKSSLVKAGLLADIKLPGMVGNVALVRHAVMRPGDGDGDAVDALASALFQHTALPELRVLRYDPQQLGEVMRERPGRAALPIGQGLDKAAAEGALTERAESRLAVIVDQMEEIFTHERITAEARQAFVDVLAALAASGSVWIVATLRSDFFERLETLPALAALAQGEGCYILACVDDHEIAQIIRQPAKEAGLRFDSDPDKDVALDDVLLEVASRDQSVLPLLEFTLDELWKRRTETGLLTFQAFDELGGLEGALGQRAETIFSGLAGEVQAVLPQVLRALVTAEQGAEGKVTSRACRMDRFAPGSPERALVDALVAARLFVAGGDDRAAEVRLAHEALLTHWPRATERVEEDRDDLQKRARIEAAATVWQNKGRDRGLLLRSNLMLAEADDLLARSGPELDRDLTAFVVASRNSSRRRRGMFYAAGLAIFGLLGAGAYYFYDTLEARNAMQARRAEAARTDITGTLFAYAGSPGEVVFDGAGNHGAYTEELLRTLVEPDLTLTEAVMRAHSSVLRKHRGQQTPQMTTSLNGDIFLHESPAGREKYAFVVGVGDYEHLDKLKNPINDAKAIAALIERLGYRTDLLINVSDRQLRRSAQAFLAKLRRESGERKKSRAMPDAGLLHLATLQRIELGGSRDSHVVIYFAGQGVEVNNRSLFPATDARADDKPTVERTWFDVNSFVQALSEIAKVRVIILDFCRDDPFVRKGETLSR